MNEEERRRHMHGRIETAASLVCCTDVQLGWFGEIGEVLSDLGHKEGVNKPSTIISNPTFTMRWTCLSLVAIRQMMMMNVISSMALEVSLYVRAISHSEALLARRGTKYMPRCGSLDLCSSSV